LDFLRSIPDDEEVRAEAMLVEWESTQIEPLRE
jgi:hypothetical protein